MNRTTRSSTRILRPQRTSLRLVAITPNAPLQEQARAQAEEIEKLYLLLESARDLGGEVNMETLVPKIVARTSRIMRCERSSVFLLDRERQELYTLVAEGLEAKEFRFPASKGLAGHVARTGETLNVPDAYEDARFNPEVDRQTGYRTRSVLAMPLRDRKGGVLGVVQCLNKSVPGGAVAFGQEDENFLGALANLLASYLESAQLYAQMDRLFAAFVSAMSRSIDDRDPCTSGHSRRVTLYALNLAKAVHESDAVAFRAIRYTRERMRQLRYAGLLHDVGKIGVREYVLCKADKLPPLGMDLIRARYENLALQRKAEVLERAARSQSDPEAMLREEYEPLAGQLVAARKLVEAKNRPAPVNDEELAALKALHAQGWLTSEELEVLSIRRGNLTAAEWEDIKAHVTKSYEILLRIPWPRELSEVPEVAYTHHEKRDGSGYPRALKGDAIHFDGQVLCVADIYDALTASDRPYKKAIPHEIALKILMDEEAGRFKLLPELVELFFEKRCFEINDVQLKELQA
ncbi:MAG: hypothetical protein AMXMBFR7_20000 [Planctomycetota bacterium]